MFTGIVFEITKNSKLIPVSFHNEMKIDFVKTSIPSTCWQRIAVHWRHDIKKGLPLRPHLLP
jgi:hypothetical protein